MSGNDLRHLSSCVLCGKDLGDEAVPATVGGLDVRLHPACRQAGLEGRDLDSPWDGAPELADGPGPTPGDGPPPDETGTEAADGSPSAKAKDEPEPGAPGPEGASRSRTATGNGGAGEAGDGGDPDWTRITDFS